MKNTLPTLTEWREKTKVDEMGAAVGAIVSPEMCHNPDFQVQGAFCQTTKKRKKRAKKK